MGIPCKAVAEITGASYLKPNGKRNCQHVMLI